MRALKRSYAIAVGDPFESGVALIGPFEQLEGACQFAMREDWFEPWRVVELIEPVAGRSLSWPESAPSPEPH